MSKQGHNVADVKVKAPAKAKAKAGRPTDYNETIATLVCDRVATHPHGLNKLCAMWDDMPVPSTIYLWRLKHPAFSEMYAQAKMMQADILAEQCLEIADDDSNDIRVTPEGYETCNTEFVARSRLRIDTRKWLAMKLLPKQYGNGPDENKTPAQSLVEKLIDKLVE